MARTINARSACGIAADRARRWGTTRRGARLRPREPTKSRHGSEAEGYVFKNSRLPEYKIERSSDIAARSHGLQKSQNFYRQKVAIFEGEGHLEDTVREMLAYCLLSREVAAGTEGHACWLQTALAAIGHAIDSQNAQQ